MRYFEIVHETSMRLEGWWIMPDGELVACDHADDLHHAQIALDFFPPDHDDADDPDDDGGDAAIQAAMFSGWIRGSYVPNRELAISFREVPSKSAARSLISWMRQHDEFASVAIHTGDAYRQFTDMRSALSFLQSVIIGRSPP